MHRLSHHRVLRRSDARALPLACCQPYLNYLPIDQMAPWKAVLMLTTEALDLLPAWRLTYLYHRHHRRLLQGPEEFQGTPGTGLSSPPHCPVLSKSSCNSDTSESFHWHHSNTHGLANFDRIACRH